MNPEPLNAYMVLYRSIAMLLFWQFYHWGLMSGHLHGIDNGFSGMSWINSETKRRLVRCHFGGLTCPTESRKTIIRKAPSDHLHDLNGTVALLSLGTWTYPILNGFSQFKGMNDGLSGLSGVYNIIETIPP